MASFDEKVKNIAQSTHDINAATDQFAVSQPPFHAHTGADSSKINFNNLKNRNEFLNIVIQGTSAATTGNYGVIFIAPYTCMFIGATEVHQALGTGGACTVQIEKLVGTTASGSGTALLSTGFDLAAAINTTQTGKLAFAASNTFGLNKGDRLGLVITGTPTSVAQVVIVIQLKY